MGEEITIPLIDNECVICYETMCTRDVLYPCRHHIHTECFLKTRTNLCPLCRQVVENPEPNYQPNYNYDYIPANALVNFPMKQFVYIFIGICIMYSLVIIMSLIPIKI
jgi:hypothetical protein